MKRFGLLALLASVSALALPTARIELPEGLDSRAERLPVSGFGGHNKGVYQLAEYHGEFKRGESRLGVMDPLFVSNKGRSSFTLQDADAAELLRADCEFVRKSVTINVVTFDPKKMTYQCEFRREGSLLGARLAIGHPKPSGFKERLLARDSRRGESNIFEQHLFIESLHRYEKSRFDSSAPIGYVLSREGRAVAALELTDINPTVIIAPDLTADLRRSAIATALALSVLRDPANSALED
jgi:hypothetical protein